VTALAVAPSRTRRGWRGPTEHKPFPSLSWPWLDWTYAHFYSPAAVADVSAFEAATTMAPVEPFVEPFVIVGQPW
jgi:hypothetical protein